MAKNDAASSIPWRQHLEAEAAAELDLGGHGRLRAAERHLALLFTGALRGHVDDVLAEMAPLVAAARTHVASAKAFAYLNLDDEEFNREWMRTVDRPPVNATAAKLVAAFAGWDVPIELERDRPGHPLLPDAVAAGCQAEEDRSVTQSRPRASRRYFRVRAATLMLEADERRSGRRFSHVIELRPDLCANGLRRFVAFAAASLSHASPFPLVVHDLAAAYPRWAAGAFASLWRFGCADSAAMRCLSVAQHKRLVHFPLTNLFHSAMVFALNLLNFWAPEEIPRLLRGCQEGGCKGGAGLLPMGRDTQRPRRSQCAAVTTEQRCVTISMSWAEGACPTPCTLRTNRQAAENRV